MQNRSIISFFFFIYEFMKGHSISWKLPSYQISIETVVKELLMTVTLSSDQFKKVFDQCCQILCGSLSRVLNYCVMFVVSIYYLQNLAYKLTNFLYCIYNIITLF